MQPRRLLHDIARLPSRQQAAIRIEAVPVVELSELTGAVAEVLLRVPPRETRHEWSLGTAEQLSLQVLIQARCSHCAFEIGTFNGGRPRLLAGTLPGDGHVMDDRPADRPFQQDATTNTFPWRRRWHRLPEFSHGP